MRESLLELRPAHVGNADVPDEPVFGEPRERPHGRPPRRPRIRRMDEVEVDRQAVERVEARLAVRPDRLRPPVRRPGAVRPRHAALRHDSSGRVRTARPKGACQQPLVVTKLFCAAPVCMRSIEHRDAGARRRCDGLQRALVVALLVGRETHAAEPDAELVRSRPSPDAHDVVVLLEAKAKGADRTDEGDLCPGVGR